MGDLVAHAVARAIELALWPLDLLPRTLALVVLGVVTAVGMLLVVKYVAPQRLMRRARDRMAGSIYEMRLFLDAPRRVLAAQARLIGWTVVYLLCLAPAGLVLIGPLGLLYVHLDARFGQAPLTAPTTIVARVELAPGTDGDALAITSDGAIAVTAPVVWAADEHAAYVRLRVKTPGIHVIHVRAGSGPAVDVDKLIVADPDASAVAPIRQHGWAQLWSAGDEPPPEIAAVRAISISYPARPQHWFGLGVPWWLCWLTCAMVVALALRNRLGVAI